MIEERKLRVFLVEDEALIAMMAEDMIEGLGHAVTVTAVTAADALNRCNDGQFDVALLDVNLNGDSGLPVAAALSDKGVPFAFTTGYGSGAVSDTFHDVPVLPKPYSVAALGAMLEQLGDQFAGSSSTTSTVDSNRG